MNDGGVIVVGASAGIGRELAKVFARNGHEVGLTARRREKLVELADELPTAGYVKEMDIAETDEARGRLRELAEEMGGVETIVVNAGVFFTNESLEWETKKTTIDVNVAGFTAIADAAFDYFVSRGGGTLVGLSSVGALHGGRVAPTYNASKAFVSNYLSGLRQKTSAEGLPVTVTDIKPGFVDTESANVEGAFWVAPPEVAAEQIFDAIQADRNHAYVTRRWRLVGWLLKALPESVHHLLNRYTSVD
ncbi:SDR family NAD(P)-dependent oxidoreductase [Halorussus caseinilyticus]|uniref:SDR family NAD(P)-dependent oxidoreductase n=1 Tax=Halorussus caseinilyticus TaxID=3034025 RepID=UPI0023E80E78|nr:SDR family NAD(P)-dependent oxidoreductase [Halorussus sp. DT72]